MDSPNIVSWFDGHWLDAFTRGSKQGFDSLSEKDRVLALVGAVFDHMIGAGIRVLYEGPAGANTVAMADAFDAIGAKKAAKLIRDFDRFFPGGAPSQDEDEREQQVEKLPDKAWTVWRKFDDLFDEWVPGGERVMLTQLHDWYHAQPDESATRKAKPGKKRPRRR